MPRIRAEKKSLCFIFPLYRYRLAGIDINLLIEKTTLFEKEGTS